MTSPCPACQFEGEFGFHCSYYKYHGEIRIKITRVRCPCCGVTHALIPSFSLPQTSHDTQTVEDYLREIGKGVSRRLSGALVLKQGFEFQTLKRLQRSFIRCALNWQAIFVAALPPVLTLESFAMSLALPEPKLWLVQANRKALKNGVNAIFNSRSNILLFLENKAGGFIPLNSIPP